jgi:2-polyprenyl-6-methoxyphenol hydroxylase-like FAD-dependent oxidoreductase
VRWLSRHLPSDDPAGLLSEWERVYPFAWLGILADAAPSSDELICAGHERGFALHSMRSPRVSRLYVQVDPDDDVNNWPDARIWEELHLRLAGDGCELHEGEVLESRSRRCEASSPRRCATGRCSWPATRRTSFRPPTPRA